MRIALRTPWGEMRGVGQAGAVIQLQVPATKQIAFLLSSLLEFAGWTTEDRP